MRQDTPAKYLQINRFLKEPELLKVPFSTRHCKTARNPQIRGYNHVRLSKSNFLYLREEKDELNLCRLVFDAFTSVYAWERLGIFE